MSSTIVSAVRTYTSSRSARKREPGNAAPGGGTIIVTRALPFLERHMSRTPSGELPPPPPPKDADARTRTRSIRPMRPAHDLADTDIARIIQSTGWPTSPPSSGPPTPSRSIPSSPPSASPVSKSASAFARANSTSSPIRASHSLPSRSRAKSLPRISPEERAQRRLEEKARVEAEHREAIRLEQARQAQIKADKAAFLRQLELEEHHRRMRLEEELRAAAFQKDMREREAEEAAARAREELRERRRLQKERLAEEAAWLEQCRREEAAKDEELRLKREAEREALEEERRSRIPKAGDHVGWVSIQQEGSMHWKRRWCQLRGKRMSLFNSPPGEFDLGKPVDILTLDKTSRVREGPSAPDELEFVKNSFALDVVGGRGTLLVYTDTADDKERLLACIRARTDL